MSEYDGKVVFGLELDDSGVDESVQNALRRVESRLAQAGEHIGREKGNSGNKNNFPERDGFSANMQALAEETARAAAHAAENAANTRVQSDASAKAAQALLEAWAAASAAGGAARNLGTVLQKAFAAAQKLPGAIGSLAGRLASGGSVTASKHAVGLDMVPYDGYPALLHRGEMVLNAAEAGAYRMMGAEHASAAEIDYERLAAAMAMVSVELDGRTVGKLVERGVSEAQGTRCNRAARKG